MTKSASAPRPVSSMTSRQLVRRAKLIEAVLELSAEVGCQAVQMRDVSERSGVGLGTAYRYFRSKDHLLAAALVEWQQRLTRRVLARSRRTTAEPDAQLRSYVRPALESFYRNPELTALMLQMLTASDPVVVESVVQMGQANRELIAELLGGCPEAQIPRLAFVIDACLMSAAASMVTGVSTLKESVERLEDVVSMVVEHADPQRIDCRSDSA